MRTKARIYSETENLLIGTARFDHTEGKYAAVHFPVGRPPVFLGLFINHDDAVAAVRNEEA